MLTFKRFLTEKKFGVLYHCTNADPASIRQHGIYPTVSHGNHHTLQGKKLVFMTTDINEAWVYGKWTVLIDRSKIKDLRTDPDCISYITHRRGRNIFYTPNAVSPSAIVDIKPTRDLIDISDEDIEELSLWDLDEDESKALQHDNVQNRRFNPSSTGWADSPTH